MSCTRDNVHQRVTTPITVLNMLPSMFNTAAHSDGCVGGCCIGEYTKMMKYTGFERA